MSEEIQKERKRVTLILDIFTIDIIYNIIATVIIITTYCCYYSQPLVIIFICMISNIIHDSTTTIVVSYSYMRITISASTIIFYHCRRINYRIDESIAICIQL